MRTIASLCIGLLAASAVSAQAAETGAYPARPIRIIVPQSPGGTTDLTGRVIGTLLSERIGRPVVVDNRPGAGSLHGITLATKATPDGHTLLVVASSLTIIPSTYRQVPFDPVRDLAPVTTLITYPNLVVVHPGVPVKSVKELMALARAKPGGLFFASGGVGTGTHLTAELFRIMAGVNMVHVPYKGGGPALTALMAGEVQLYFAAMPSTLPYAKSGKVKPLAVTSARRSPAVPELPALAEAGVPGYDEFTWNGLLAPARTPAPIIKRLYAEVNAVLAMPATRARFAADGSETGGSHPDAFAALIRGEVAKWARVTREAGIKPE